MQPSSASDDYASSPTTGGSSVHADSHPPQGLSDREALKSALLSFVKVAIDICGITKFDVISVISGSDRN